MAAGIGFYSLALTGTALVMIALLVFRHIRTALLHRVQPDHLLLEVEVEPARVRDLLDLTAEHGAVLESMDCEPEGELTAIRLHLRLAPDTDRAALIETVQSHTSVESAHAKRGLEPAAHWPSNRAGLVPGERERQLLERVPPRAPEQAEHSGACPPRCGSADL